MSSARDVFGTALAVPTTRGGCGGGLSNALSKAAARASMAAGTLEIYRSKRKLAEYKNLKHIEAYTVHQCDHELGNLGMSRRQNFKTSQSWRCDAHEIHTWTLNMPFSVMRTTPVALVARRLPPLHQPLPNPLAQLSPCQTDIAIVSSRLHHRLLRQVASQTRLTSRSRLKTIKTSIASSPPQTNRTSDVHQMRIGHARTPGVVVDLDGILGVQVWNLFFLLRGRLNPTTNPETDRDAESKHKQTPQEYHGRQYCDCPKVVHGKERLFWQ